MKMQLKIKVFMKESLFINPVTATAKFSASRHRYCCYVWISPVFKCLNHFSMQNTKNGFHS